MSKKNAIIIILLVVIIIIGLFLFLYFRNGDKNSNPDSGSSLTFPTSSNNDTIFGDTDNNDNTPGQPEETKVADIRQIFAEPVSGATIIENGDTPKVRFVERSNGHIHENILNSKQVIRISNTTIPKIQEALWGKDGKTIIYRYIKDGTGMVETFSGKLKLSTSTSNEIAGEVSGIFLPSNIKSIALNKNIDSVIYSILKPSNDGSIVYISNTDGSSKRQILDTKLTEFSLSWPKNNSAILYTKPSYKYNGFMYELPISNGTLSKIFGDVFGLIPNANDSLSKILYSTTLRSLPSLKVFEINGSIDTDLSISTLADKCVWSNANTDKVFCAVPKEISAGSYPDIWYQGQTLFSDNVWEINTETRATKIIAEINEKELGKIDMQNLALSKDDSYLVFTNKEDLSLWTIKLK